MTVLGRERDRHSDDGFPEWLILHAPSPRRRLRRPRAPPLSSTPTPSPTRTPTESAKVLGRAPGLVIPKEEIVIEGDLTVSAPSLSQRRSLPFSLCA